MAGTIVINPYRTWLLGCWLALLPCLPTSAHAAGLGEQALALAGFEQRPGARLPDDLEFFDAQGKALRLGTLRDTRPWVLVLAYHRCPNLCGLAIGALVDALRQLPLRVGEDYQVLVVSIDPRETPATAAIKQADAVARYGRGDAHGWHFLTGEAAAIEQLAAAVGFRYAYDAALDQYAHAAGILLVTPEGRVARYLLGLRYAPRDLRLGLTEAGQGRIGGLVEQLLLLCYDYDPQRGAYGGLIMNLLRMSGAGLLVLLGGFISRALWRERRLAGRR